MGSKVLLLGISYSRIACKMVDNEQIMKSVMFRHVSRCVLYSGVWIALLKVFVHKRPAGIWMRKTCWTDFVSEFVPSFYLHNSFSDCVGKTTHTLLYPPGVGRCYSEVYSGGRRRLPAPVPNQVKGLPHRKLWDYRL